MLNVVSGASQIIALLYSDSIAADRLISELGYALRSSGITVAGIVQQNLARPDRAKCDMRVEELASGRMLQLSEDRGREARGCRLDQGALAEAAALLSAALREGPQIVLLNKFGKHEAEGRGLRDVLAETVELGIPLIVGVPFRNIERWRSFAGPLAEECEIGSDRLSQWLTLHGLAAMSELCDSRLAGDPGARKGQCASA
jgi:nucleoside-triphosphatase THEP1